MSTTRYVRIADQQGAIYIDRSRFSYGSLTASHYSPPSNSILITEGSSDIMRFEWDVFRDENGLTFGADLASSVTALNTLFAGSGGGGGVTDVTGTAPIQSSGGATPDISIDAATTSAAGSMSASDKTKLDGIASGAEVNVNADWNASSGDAEILNKPTIATQFTQLTDTPSTLTANQALVTHPSGGSVILTAQIRGLNDLQDVTTGTPASRNTLVYDGVSAFRSGDLNLGDMSDVDGTTPSNNDVLTYDTSTSQWRPQASSGGGGGSNFISHAYGFFDSSFRNVFIPITTESESTSRQRYNRWIAPCDGSVKSISWYGTNNLTASGSPTTVDVQKMTGTTSFVTIGTANFSSITAYVGAVSNFSSNSFSAGDTLYFFLTNNFGTSPVYNVTGVILFDVS